MQGLSRALNILEILRGKMYTESNMYVIWISMQNLNKRKLSQRFNSYGRGSGRGEHKHTSGSNIPLPHQCLAFFWALGKFENPEKCSWRNILPLEGTHTLILRGPEEGILLPQISEIWLYFVCRSKLSNPFKQPIGQALKWTWRIREGANGKSSDLEMGDMWLGDLATSQFRDLEQVYSPFASWPPHEEFLR